MRVLGRKDLDNIAILELTAKRYDPSVDLCTGTRVADSRVDGIREIDRSRSARKLYDLAHGRKRIYVLWVKVQLKCLYKVLGVLVLLGFLDERKQQFFDGLTQRVESIILLFFAKALFFVFPVGGDTFLRNVVHLLGPDLHFERLA